MESPLISVLLPVRNRGHLVGQAIQSILDQTFQDFELIIIEDESVDDTLAVVRKYQKIDPRIKIFPHIHTTISDILNYGNRLCIGKIIVKQDSDDLSLPNRLARIADFFKRYSATEFFYHGMYQTWEEEGNILRRAYIPAIPITDRIFKEQYIPGCFAYTKQFSQRIPYRFSYCSDDWMLLLDAYYRKRRIGFLNEGLYEYILRDDSNSIVHKDSNRLKKDEEAMREILEKEYGLKGFVYETAV